jgi:hypothetical protein
MNDIAMFALLMCGMEAALATAGVALVWRVQQKSMGLAGYAVLASVSAVLAGRWLLQEAVFTAIAAEMGVALPLTMIGISTYILTWMSMRETLKRRAARATASDAGRDSTESVSQRMPAFDETVGMQYEKHDYVTTLAAPFK